ncbi:MAG TPA: cytochrome c [Candidatus Methylomirabilis sp.]|nr:cytochrome c [Candidatus Methylomirabilis sp.]
MNPENQSDRSDGSDRSLPAASGLLLAACCLLFAAACQQQMADQPRYKPLAQSAFFGDDRSARPPVEGTVARGHLNADERFYTGKSGGALVDRLPIPVTLELLERGQDRFNIFCAPCHDRTGSGQGMIVRRGYRQPASYHIDRLRQAPVGHFFDVMTNGFGAMPDYAAQIPPGDRWAIAAYIRALQLSQNASLADVPPAERQKLEGQK